MASLLRAAALRMHTAPFRPAFPLALGTRSYGGQGAAEMPSGKHKDYCDWVIRKQGKVFSGLYDWLQAKGVSDKSRGGDSVTEKWSSWGHGQLAGNGAGRSGWARERPRHGGWPQQAEQSSASWGASDEVCRFGKYKGMSFDQVLDKDPRYCEWIVSAASKEDSSQALRNMATFLQGKGITATSKFGGGCA
eukprot:gnl/TRDRNA2_/TRDRNA2_53868_c0_seq1.p1 gnl/TRDRNA2_/TRDRNA2_53868_c0~~gnl/TRDRNA2_/TRDRNA2_53868_c0_seq1.p1  ORF type:complete len:191 (-),score=33.86 gnl/TRDRNA2_/TRDRNA2_53868_c0_seq1:250-822(-)